jgi:hypothetical protein
LVAEDHLQRYAEGRQPIRERLLLQAGAGRLHRRCERLVVHTAQIVHELLWVLVALAAETGARELADLAAKLAFGEA